VESPCKSFLGSGELAADQRRRTQIKNPQPRNNAKKHEIRKNSYPHSRDFAYLRGPSIADLRWSALICGQTLHAGGLE